MPILSGVTFAWPSTAASIPAGWSRVSALDGKYIRGAATAGGTGGAATHTHTSVDHSHGEPCGTHGGSGTSGANSGAVDFLLLTGAGPYMPPSPIHTHDFVSLGSAPVGQYTTTTGVTWFSSATDPSYWLVIWIESDGSTGVPDGAVGFWSDEDLPTGWIQPTNGKNRFLKGAATGNDGGGTGGGSHTHTASSGHIHYCDPHAHIITTGNEYPDNDPKTGGSVVPLMCYHKHVFLTDTRMTALYSRTPTLQNTDFEPPWTKLAIIQNNTGGANAPKRIIAIWRGAADAIPRGWISCDGANDTPDLNDSRFIKGAALLNEIGNTGGATNHSHAGNSHTHETAPHSHGISTVDGAGDISGHSEGGTGSTGSCISRTHIHAAGTLTVNSAPPGPTPAATVSGASATTLPPYEDVIFIQYQYEVGISTGTNLFQQSFRAMGDQAAGNVIVEGQDLPGGDWSEPVEPTGDGAYSPSIECLPDGRLRLAVMDAAGDRQELLSTDDGETWGAA